jgi:6-methylsalicylate decarboxylase
MAGGASAWRIDIHHHVLPPVYLATTPMPVTPPEVGQQLETMDALQIRVAITSLTPRVLDAHPDQLATVARTCNEFQAERVRDHPDRFGAFALLPLPEVGASLQEIAYALDVLHLDGVGLFSSTQGQYLGDPRLEPIFEELQRRRATVFVHPSHCGAPAEWKLRVPDATLEYVFDTTRAIVNMAYSGTFKRCPNAPMIFAHGGGTLPFLVPRITAGARSQVPDMVDTFRSLYFDVASAMGRQPLRALQELADPTHILWGSDLPFVSAERVAEEIDYWNAYDGLDESERMEIEQNNPLRLFPRFAVKQARQH